MKLTFCQINIRLGDCDYNSKKIIEEYKKAAVNGTELVVFPELALTGYPLYDLVYNPEFIAKIEKYTALIIKETKHHNTAILFGTPAQVEGGIYNIAIFASNGKIVGKVGKRHLPNYGIFNESRNFTSELNQQVLSYKGEKLGILICEDMWFDDVALAYAKQGATLFIAINASPFDTEKHQTRKIKAANIAKESGLELIYVNMIGGQDEMVFDGGSFILDAKGEYILKPQCWNEQVISYNTQTRTIDTVTKNTYSELEHIYQALMCSIRDYVSKNGFKKCVVGLSGGVDSAFVSTIIADSIGPENLHCVILPTEFTSSASASDATKFVDKIGCKFSTINITNIYQDFLQLLQPVFANKAPDASEENLQARIRGTVLMAISNKTGALLIATSNKSESMMGYTTLYGDMCGGFSLIKDVYKTTLYELAHWRNNHIPRNSTLPATRVIPENILTKEPSAELKHDQKDSDSLPPYTILDQILYALIEQDLAHDVIARELGIKLELVKDIASKITRTEFKRSQAAIGPKIGTKAFGSERRYPITA